MKTVFFSKIRPAEGQSLDYVIKKAREIGYLLVSFDGWDNSDLGSSGNHGPSWEESRLNQKKIDSIQDACKVEYNDGSLDWPHIISTLQVIN